MKTAKRTVELRLFITSAVRPTKKADEPPPKSRPTSEVVLSCRTEKAPDGSSVTLQASTEDITGGAFGKGFSADVIHLRDHSAALVSEILPTRDKAFVEMTDLPCR